MIGQYVNKNVIDQAVFQSVVQIRTAFAQAEIINNWLSDHPVTGGVDPLTTDPDFGQYTPAEAAEIRAYFSGLDTLYIVNVATFESGRKFTAFY